MSSLFKDAAMSAEFGWIGASITLLFLTLFVAWTVWALWPGNRQKFDDASRMPLDDGGAA